MSSRNGIRSRKAEWPNLFLEGSLTWPELLNITFPSPSITLTKGMAPEPSAAASEKLIFSDSEEKLYHTS